MPDGSNYSPDNPFKINRRKFVIGAAAAGITAAVGGVPLLNEYARSHERPLDPFEYVPELPGIIDALQQGNEYRQIFNEKDTAELFADIIEFRARKDIEMWQINDVDVHHGNPSVAFNDNQADFTVDMSLSARTTNGIKQLLEKAGLTSLQNTLENTAQATYTSSARYTNREEISPHNNLTYRYIVSSLQSRENYGNQVIEKEVSPIEKKLIDEAKTVNGTRVTNDPRVLFSCTIPTQALTHIGHPALIEAGVQDYVVEMEIKDNALEIIHTTKALKEKRTLEEKNPLTS